MNNQTKQARPKYTLEFKRDAVNLVLEKGYTHRQAAINWGVFLRARGRWVRAERAPTAAASTRKAALNLTDHREVTRLRRENEPLRMEREILKKAAGLEAKEIE
jgi:transposase